MGNDMSIIPFRCYIPDLSIAEKWRSSWKEAEPDVQVDMIITLLNDVINSTYCGLGKKLDYVFLTCTEDRAEQIYPLLIEKEAMKGLAIEKMHKRSKKRIDRPFSFPAEKYFHDDEYVTTMHYGIEIRPSPIVETTTLNKEDDCEVTFNADNSVIYAKNMLRCTSWIKDERGVWIAI
jgi:hypothetical protein